MTDYKSWVGKRAVAKTLQGRVQGRGQIIGIFQAPTFSIKCEDGTRFSWRCDMCELELTEEEKLREALKITDDLARQAVTMLEEHGAYIINALPLFESNAELLGDDDDD